MSDIPSPDADKSPSPRGVWHRLKGLTSARQSILAIFDQAILGGTNFLTAIFVGRVCGAEGLGVFGVGLTVIYLLVATQESLITVPYTIFIARAKGEKQAYSRGSTLLTYLALSALACVILAVIMLISLLVGTETQLTLVVGALAVLSPCYLLREFVRRIAYAEFQLGSSLAINIVMMVIQAVGLASLGYLGIVSPVSSLLVVAFANLVAGLTWFALTKDSFAFSASDFSDTIAKHWHLGRFIFATQIVNAISLQALPWLIVVVLGTSATGALIACQQVTQLANPLLVGLANILTPRTARAFTESGRAGMDRVVREATAVFGILMTCFCVALILLGKLVLGKLFGAEYAVYADVLVILAFAKMIDAIAIGPVRGLVVLDRAKDCLKADTAKFLGTFVTTIALISHFGITGAAWGALCGSILATGLIAIFYVKLTRLRSEDSQNAASPV